MVRDDQTVELVYLLTQHNNKHNHHNSATILSRRKQDILVALSGRLFIKFDTTANDKEIANKLSSALQDDEGELKHQIQNFIETDQNFKLAFQRDFAALQKEIRAEFGGNETFVCVIYQQYVSLTTTSTHKICPTFWPHSFN
jgi:hypothetical protein